MCRFPVCISRGVWACISVLKVLDWNDTLFFIVGTFSCWHSAFFFSFLISFVSMVAEGVAVSNAVGDDCGGGQRLDED